MSNPHYTYVMFNSFTINMSTGFLVKMLRGTVIMFVYASIECGNWYTTFHTHLLNSINAAA